MWFQLTSLVPYSRVLLIKYFLVKFYFLFEKMCSIKMFPPFYKSVLNTIKFSIEWLKSTYTPSQPASILYKYDIYKEESKIKKNYINHKKYFFSFISLFSIFIVCYAVYFILFNMKRCGSSFFKISGTS